MPPARRPERHCLLPRHRRAAKALCSAAVEPLRSRLDEVQSSFPPSVRARVPRESRAIQVYHVLLLTASEPRRKASSELYLSGRYELPSLGSSTLLAKIL